MATRAMNTTYFSMELLESDTISLKLTLCVFFFFNTITDSGSSFRLSAGRRLDPVVQHHTVLPADVITSSFLASRHDILGMTFFTIVPVIQHVISLESVSDCRAAAAGLAVISFTAARLRVKEFPATSSFPYGIF